MDRSTIQDEAYARAVNGHSLANYPAIFEGFAAKGIPESEIKPRENVFTFAAWKKLGRVVCKGEHGVKVVTWIDYEDRKTGERKRRPKTTTVFHLSQTKALGEEGGRAASTPVYDQPALSAAPYADPTPVDVTPSDYCEAR